jgi:chemotaxis protein histidine kinase CheA
VNTRSILTTTFALLPLVAAPLLLSSPADARRRILGSDEGDNEDEEDKKAAEDAKQKREAAAKKAEEEAAKKAEEKKKQKEEAKQKREAAKQAAAEAAARKKEEAERKKTEAIEKENARLEGNKAARLLAAKKLRRITRRSGELAITVSLVPGAPSPDKVQEIRVDVAQELKVADVKWGKFRPQMQAQLVAEVAPPETGQDETPRRFYVHRLSSPGAYGFHVTPEREGQHTITIEGKADDGTPINLQLNLFVGEWPPPDFESEEANNAKTDAKAGSGRRIAGGK